MIIIFLVDDQIGLIAKNVPKKDKNQATYEDKATILGDVFILGCGDHQIKIKKTKNKTKLGLKFRGFVTTIG